MNRQRVIDHIGEHVFIDLKTQQVGGIAEAAEAITTGDMGAFVNRLRILRSIDRHEVWGLEIGAYTRFARDPYDFLMRADDEKAAVIWAAVEKREARPKPKCSICNDTRIRPTADGVGQHCVCSPLSPESRA